MSKKKKYTIEYIKKFANNYGFEVISDDYINAREKLIFKCSKGHIREMTWDNFMRRKSCGECIGNQKYTLETVKKEAKKNGFTILSDKYVNANTPMDVVCKNGHHSKKTFSSIKQGLGCKFCATNSKPNLFHIKQFINNEGYIINCDLNLVYVNNTSKIPVTCPKGHHVFIDWAHFSHGQRCRKCNGGSKLTQNEVKEMLHNIGIELLSKYVNYDTKIKYKCTCGKIAYGYLGALLKGIRCGCGIKSGELSILWNHEKTQEEREHQRKYPEYYIWVKKVYERDNYICQCCGEKGGKLNAHHIKNYSTNKEIRTEISNGITLCEDCHKDFHKIYGFKNNNNEQLSEYIKNYRLSKKQIN